MTYDIFWLAAYLDTDGWKAEGIHRFNKLAEEIQPIRKLESTQEYELKLMRKMRRDKNVPDEASTYAEWNKKNKKRKNLDVAPREIEVVIDEDSDDEE